LLPEFANEPLTDFSTESHRSAIRAALTKVESRLPIEGRNRIGGKRVGAAKTFKSVEPCDRKQVIGVFPQGTKEDAQRAIETGLGRLSRGRRCRRKNDPRSFCGSRRSSANANTSFPR
jgi:delta 1-pyrroline-5-carboxylate dehydrogenase